MKICDRHSGPLRQPLNICFVFRRHPCGDDCRLSGRWLLVVYFYLSVSWRRHVIRGR